ncbi:alpha/beta hydrolase [Prosthecomicrobium hirschii]|uniref:alpha/beta hydrolase n=1 Tax=Prosthecodimorpha hirschii TaxID=665126 RepID=UPI002220CA32|nr:alpha/beta hydrolase [Prosthecomicrobium hirschii]MCW1840086.1 alpha/beta hydrolase [Prosthecomicrobium hirschii]
MPLDPRAARFLDMAAAGRAEPRERTIAERRAGLAKLMAFARADRMGPPGRDLALPGPAGTIPARLYGPVAATADARLPGLVFLHGGGLVAGSIATHDVIARALAEASGCRLVSVGYRLAPEHRYPAAAEDAEAALRAIYATASDLGIDPERIGLVGESGGAALAVGVAVAARSAGPRIALMGLICPVLDCGGESASRIEFAEGYLIDRATLEADLADLLPPGFDPADPRLSPLRLADLAGLPPAIIHTAECDPLRDEGEAFAARLAAAGMPVTLQRHDGMVHNFHALGAVLPQGRAALDAMGVAFGAALRG